MSIFLRLPGRFYGAESCKVVSFPLSISHFWKEAGPGEDLFRNFLKKWPADGAAALAAPKASRGCAGETAFKQTGGKLSVSFNREKQD